jgi:hypothetical protein
VGLGRLLLSRMRAKAREFAAAGDDGVAGRCKDNRIDDPGRCSLAAGRRPDDLGGQVLANCGGTDLSSATARRPGPRPLIGSIADTT